ncbi:MAG: helix-turn-helix transcriptional regulator [Eubacteriales bacterium]|nr:helix-turn-helix transcriptional regulator [Eubacteriales bacterium]
MFNKRLRETRMKCKFTQQNMADKLGISLNAYQKYEQAERSPSLDCLVSIADIFNVSTDYLLCRDEFIKSHGVSVDEH